MTKQRQKWGVGARSEERLSEGGGGGGRAQLEPGKSHRLTPSPEVFCPRLAEAAEGANPKRAAEGRQRAGKRAMLLSCGGLEWMESRV